MLVDENLSNMYEENIFLYIALGIEWLIIVVCFRLIWQYLNHKLLGKNQIINTKKYINNYFADRYANPI